MGASMSGITFVFQGIGTTCITGFGAYMSFLCVTRSGVYSDRESDWFIEFPMVVVVVCGVIAFAVATAFMFIIDITSDTLLLCWLSDTEECGVDFVPKSLKDLIDKPLR